MTSIDQIMNGSAGSDPDRDPRNNKRGKRSPSKRRSDKSKDRRDPVKPERDPKAAPGGAPEAIYDRPAPYPGYGPGYGYGYGGYGGYGYGYGGGRQEFPILHYLALARRRWITLLVATLVGLAGTAYKLSITTKLYEAKSLVEMSVRRPRIINRAEAVMDENMRFRNEEVFNTRLAKFRGKAMRTRVVESLKKKGLPAHVAAGGASAEISLIRDSYLVKFVCRDPTPEVAALRANAFAEAAERMMFDENQMMSDKAVAWLRVQADAKKELVEQADAALVAFRKESGLDALLEKKQTSTEAVRSLNKLLVSVDGEKAQLSAFLAALNETDTDLNAVGKLPDAIPHAESIREKLDAWRTAKAELGALKVKYRAQHPKMLAAAKQADVLAQRVGQGVREARATIAESLNLANTRIRNLQKKIEAERERVSDLELQTMQLQTKEAELNREQQVAEMSYRGILNRIEEARLSADEDTTTVTVAETASVPSSPVYPQPGRWLFMGLMLGIAAGAGIAIVREWLDDYITSAWEIEEGIGLRMLGLVPLVDDDERTHLAVACHKGGSSEMAETFAGIRGMLVAPQNAEKSRSILITSTAPEAGKTVVACNLAAMYARSGTRTLVVDLDLRRPQLGKIFAADIDMPSLTHGLAEHIEHDEVFEDLVIESDCDNLYVICNRVARDVSATDIIASDRLKRFLRWAEENYDQVILDTPPHGMLSDVGMLAGQVGGVIMVCRANSTRRRAVRHAIKHLRDIDANVLGAIVNGVAVGWGSSFSGYDYYHQDYYYSGYYYSGEKGKPRRVSGVRDLWDRVREAAGRSAERDDGKTPGP